MNINQYVKNKAASEDLFILIKLWVSFERIHLMPAPTCTHFNSSSTETCLWEEFLCKMYRVVGLVFLCS